MITTEPLQNFSLEYPWQGIAAPRCAPSARIIDSIIKSGAVPMWKVEDYFYEVGIATMHSKALVAAPRGPADRTRQQRASKY